MTANDIRNIALLGHGGSGKTSLAEQMLFMTKGTDRLGKTADGNTTCDYDAEEIKRQISISLAFAPVQYKGKKINVMDAPGNFDFSGEAVCAIRAAECAVIVGNAKDGLSVGMERTWKMLGKKPRMMFINRVEEANSDYASCIEAIKAKYGTAIAPSWLPRPTPTRPSPSLWTCCTTRLTMPRVSAPSPAIWPTRWRPCALS